MDIIYFIAGCLFSLLLTGACLFVSYKVLQYKEDTDIRRSEKAKAILKRSVPSPSGGVIRPKTTQQIAEERNEELDAFKELLSDPGKE